MALMGKESLPDGNTHIFPLKLWIYTNYDCNLRCSYCLARSSPGVERRAIGLETACRLVDEAHELGFECVYFTGGEPFLLDEIYDMLAYASSRMPTVVLTNGMLLRGKRLERLAALRGDNLTIQVSLDGAQPEHHDAYRGSGSWMKTVEGIKALLSKGMRVRLSTTETPANCGHLDAICSFHQELGIGESDHLVRLLARRGFSQEGIEVRKNNVEPEITVNVDGVYWHPLSTDEDLLISTSIFPLANAVWAVQEHLAALIEPVDEPVKSFK